MSRPEIFQRGFVLWTPPVCTNISTLAISTFRKIHNQKESLKMRDVFYLPAKKPQSCPLLPRHWVDSWRFFLRHHCKTLYEHSAARFRTKIVETLRMCLWQGQFAVWSCSVDSGCGRTRVLTQRDVFTFWLQTSRSNEIFSQFSLSPYSMKWSRIFSHFVSLFL